MASRVTHGKHRTQPIPRNDPRYRLQRDTQPWRMHRWRYRRAGIVLVTCDAVIVATVITLAAAAGLGVYLAVTHKPVPAPIARMLGNPPPAAPTHAARDSAPAPTPSAIRASKHAAHMAHLAHSHASPSAMPSAGLETALCAWTPCRHADAQQAQITP